MVGVETIRSMRGTILCELNLHLFPRSRQQKIDARCDQYAPLSIQSTVPDCWRDEKLYREDLRQPRSDSENVNSMKFLLACGFKSLS